MAIHASPTYLKLLPTIRENPNFLTSEFNKHFLAIRSEMLKFDGVWHSLVFPGNPIKLDYIRAGLLLSDVFQMTYTGSPDVMIAARPGNPGRISSVNPDGTVNVDPIQFNDEIIEGAALISSAGPQFRRLFRYLEPVIQSGHLMLTPHAVVVARKNNSTNLANMTFYGVEMWESEWNWLNQVLTRGTSQPSAKNSRLLQPPEELANVIVPFLRGVPMKRFSQILEDESDRLAKFRSALRAAAVESAKEPRKDIVQDIVRPELESLTRRFRQIIQSHSLKASGAVVTTLGLTLVASYAPWAFPQLAPALGSGGLGFILKSFADYRDDRQKVAESAWFPLWKLSQYRTK